MSQQNDPATPPADGSTAPPPGGDPSLLEQGQGAENAWLPEKYRVKVDGKDEIDFQASARKLGEGYKALEAKLGTGAVGTVPATAGEYKLTAPVDAEGKPLVENVDLEEFVSDPIFKTLADKAHKAGISNETLNFFVGEYLQFIPDVLKSSVQLDHDAAKQALSAVWKDQGAMSKGLQQAARAAQGFSAESGQLGSFDNLMQKFGNDPDFLAFAARIGAEMGEDKPISSDPVAQADWDEQVATIKADPAYMDKANPKHAGLMNQLNALYQRRYGNNQRQLGGSATR